MPTAVAAVAFLGLAALPGAMASDKPPETNGKTVTSWIPITSAYPSQPLCPDLFWSYVPNTIAAWDPGYGISVDDGSHSCHPKAVTTWWDAERLGHNTLTTVSLGPFTCPQAYFTAKTSVKDTSSTMVACCPAYVNLISLSLSPPLFRSPLNYLNLFIYLPTSYLAATLLPTSCRICYLSIYHPTSTKKESPPILITNPEATPSLTLKTQVTQANAGPSCQQARP